MIVTMPFLVSTQDGKCSQKRISGATGFLFLENKYKANAALRNGKPQELAHRNLQKCSHLKSWLGSLMSLRVHGDTVMVNHGEHR